MATKYLAGLVGVVLVVGCLSAQAMTSNDPTLSHYPAVNGFAHKGNYVADFIQGRLVATEPRGETSAAATVDEDRAARYASQSGVLTIVFLAIVAVALSFFAGIGKIRRRSVRREASSKDAWKEALFEMLEADLTHLDSMTHGFSGR
jgi:hypothetical protein